MFNFTKNKIFDLSKSFPCEIKHELDCVIKNLSYSRKMHAIAHEIKTSFYYSTDFIAQIPSRYFCKDISRFKFIKLSTVQKQICCCIFLLNPNGYIREKYLKILLSMDLKEWALPFLINISADYVKEILQTFYECFDLKYKDLFYKFCMKNLKQTQTCYSRMVTLWDLYYRNDTLVAVEIDGRQGFKSNLKKYPGYKLFHERFGFSPRRKCKNDRN